jgi:hypothetical protein
MADATPSPALQIALDCADPHAQARFWAAALGYEVEHVEALVRRMLDAGYATQDDVTTVDGELAWKTAAAMSDPTGARPRWFFQGVPEPKAAKNRMHVDIRVGVEGRAAEVERLIGLGATKLYDGQLGPQTWVTMADPEGNEFCVT